MAVKLIAWRQQFVVAVTRGSKISYHYGTTRKEAIERAHLRPGDAFAYAKFVRGPVRWAEVGHAGRTIVEHGPYRRK